MSGVSNQVEITAEMMSSAAKIETRFKDRALHFTSKPSDPLLLIFTVNYRWEEPDDEKLYEFDFTLLIKDDKGQVIHSEYRHFGDEEPGFVGKEEKDLNQYVKEERYLKYYKTERPLRKGEGTMVRSLKTPDKHGKYNYTFEIVSQFWARRLGEERGLEKNKTESSAKLKVTVDVS